MQRFGQRAPPIRGLRGMTLLSDSVHKIVNATLGGSDDVFAEKRLEDCVRCRGRELENIT